jgi:uncharacterized membrane protein
LLRIPDTWLFGIGLLITVISMPYFNLGMSIGGIWTGSAWLVYYARNGFDSADWKSSLLEIWKNPTALLLLGIFIIHLVGITYSEDQKHAGADVLIKLPLLVFPFTMASMPEKMASWRKTIENAFILSVFSAVLLISVNYLLNIEIYPNSRDAHMFTSHIRFGLMCALAFALLIQRIFDNGYSKKSVFYIFILGCFGIYYLLMQNMTGLVCSAFVVVIGVLMYPEKYGKRTRYILQGFVVLTLLISSAIIWKSVNDYFPDVVPAKGSLEVYSPEGTMYAHHWGDSQVENGHLVWYYIAWPELERSWNDRSHLDFGGKDEMGQPLYATIVRYMSSKGLKKDASSLSQLSDEDIQAIERGTTNCEDHLRSGFEFRTQQILFEINAYLNGANPSGNSLTQRLEFWKAGMHIIRKNPVIGCGTGDLRQEFALAYDEMNSQLDSSVRHRAHNQFMSICIAFGLVGLIYFVAALILPFFLNKARSRNFTYVAFFSIICLSFLSEDTLETQAGVTFFAFFIAYLLLFPSAKASTRDTTSSTEISNP